MGSQSIMRLSRFSFCLCQPPTFQPQHGVSRSCQRFAVGHCDDALAAVMSRLCKQIDDATSGGYVKITGWLVSKEHLRRTGKGSGDGDALLLPA